MFTFFWSVLILAVGVWIVSVHVAWIINRPELHRTYNHVPWNWRILGFSPLYIPYLERINYTKED